MWLSSCCLVEISINVLINFFLSGKTPSICHRAASTFRQTLWCYECLGWGNFQLWICGLLEGINDVWWSSFRSPNGKCLSVTPMITDLLHSGHSAENKLKTICQHTNFIKLVTFSCVAFYFSCVALHFLLPVKRDWKRFRYLQDCQYIITCPLNKSHKVSPQILTQLLYRLWWKYRQYRS